MQVAIYARVSTDKQDEEMQLNELRKFAIARNWEVYREYVDAGISGTKESRPALNELMADAKKRKFDIVLVWAFDRFARSLKQLVLALEEFRGLNIQFCSYQQNIDTTGPAGMLLFQIFAAFAEFERAMIVSRVKAGVANARSKGKRIGRPRAELDAAYIRQRRAQGASVRALAAELKVGVGTIHRLVERKPCAPVTELSNGSASSQTKHK